MSEAILAGDAPETVQVVCGRGHVTAVFASSEITDQVGYVGPCPRQNCAHRADWRRSRPPVPMLHGRHDDTPAGY